MTILEFPRPVSDREEPRPEPRRPDVQEHAPQQLPEFHELRRHGDELLAAGDPHGALAVYERALQLAEKAGEHALVERGQLAWSTAAVELGRTVEVRSLLSDLVERPRGLPAMLAAYHVARSFEKDGELKKAVYYSRLAVQRSHDLEPTYQAAAWNALGNQLLAESRTTEATRAYETALSLIPSSESLRRSSILDNLGYCRALDGALRPALKLLLSALRTQLRHGARFYLASTHLDLAFVFLELGKLRWAESQGRHALAIAGEMDDPQSERNALYLLGEIATQADDTDRASSYFHQLQQRFFPGSPEIVHYLMAVDARSMVNLRA